MNDEEIDFYKKTFGKSFSSLLYEMRVANRSQTEGMVAKDIKISHRHFSNIKNGDHNLTFDKILRIMDYFDVSFEWLIGKTDQRKLDYDTEIGSYGLDEDSLDVLRYIKSGHLAYYREKPNGFNPKICGYKTDRLYKSYGDNYYRMNKRYFDEESDGKSREQINTESLMRTINYIISNHELCQLIDSYLHSEWAREPLSEDTVGDNLDSVILERIRSCLDEERTHAFRIRSMGLDVDIRRELNEYDNED